MLECGNKVVFFDKFSLLEALKAEANTPQTAPVASGMGNIAEENKAQDRSRSHQPDAVSPPAQKPDWKKLHRNKQREKYRQKEKGQQQLENFKTKHRQQATVVSTSQDSFSLKHTKPGFTGLPESKRRKVLPGEGPIYIPVEENQKSTALVDKDGRVFAIRVTPNIGDNEQRDGVTAAVRQLERASKNKQVPITTSRGTYNTVTFGVSYGHGQTLPQKLQDRANEDCIQEFIENVHVQAYVKHATNAFNTWNSRLLEHYMVEMKKLEPAGLFSPFPDCPFMASTVNLGPQTVTNLHRDSQNLAHGWCAIIALGNFDHKNGGQIHLEEANATLEFAPGQIIFIPSAVVTHGNVAIQPGEERYSFTLYTAGQLFQWVHNGCKPKKSVPPESPDVGEKRWHQGWSLYSTASELGLKVDV